jgi:hypothetical protein
MRKYIGTIVAIGAATLISGAIRDRSARAEDGDANADEPTAYQQTNLVSNVAGLAPTTDPNLLNPIVPLVVAIPPADSSTPTGMVWNPNPNQFMIPGTTVGAVFIFDGEDGTITAWNPTADPVTAGKSTASPVIDNSPSGAVYKGLAYGTVDGSLSPSRSDG